LDERHLLALDPACKIRLAASDFPLHRDDSLQTAFGCAGGNRLCFHQHNYTVGLDNKLRVTISRPEPL
jgi:hypothetical protein